MRIRIKNPAAEQSISEYVMGLAEREVIFPGIAQCFGVVGLFGGRMLCVHVSPGTTQEEMGAIFENLRLMGGDNVLDWHLVGPCENHFAVTRAVWRSTRDIKKTFRATFGRVARLHLLDATEERSQRVLFEGAMWPISSIDVRVTRRGPGLSFDYKEGRTAITDWTPLNLGKFNRL